MPTETQRSPLDILNPDMNGGGYQAVCLCPGLDFVFVLPGPGITEPPRARLFYEHSDHGLDGFTIEETSTSGSVPLLRATNASAFDVLLIAGQLFKGGKQNRGINTDILVGAGKTADIPVTCVEQGRWSGRPGDRFRHGGIEPIYIRSAKFRDVSDRRRGGRGFEANQHQVWSGIDQMSRELGAESAGGDLLASLQTVKDRRERRDARPQRMAGREPGHLPGGAPWRPESEIHDLERRLETAREEAQQLVQSMNRALRSPDAGDLTASRRRLDSALRELGDLQRQIDRAREESRALHAPIPAITPLALDQANCRALGALGMLVFFHGEFLAGDIFASHEWFLRFYGDLRDSALMTWDMVAKRHNASGRPMDQDARDKANSLARSVVGDALRGGWVDRPTAAQGRSQMLEHPYLEGALLSDDNGAPLHLLVGSKHTPEVLRA